MCESGQQAQRHPRCGNACTCDNDSSHLKPQRHPGPGTSVLRPTNMGRASQFEASLLSNGSHTPPAPDAHVSQCIHGTGGDVAQDKLILRRLARRRILPPRLAGMQTTACRTNSIVPTDSHGTVPIARRKSNGTGCASQSGSTDSRGARGRSHSPRWHGSPSREYMAGTLPAGPEPPFGSSPGIRLLSGTPSHQA